MKLKKIGVLSIQGSVVEHATLLEQIGVKAVHVHLPEDLKGLDGLIIPGGESTTIGKLLVIYGLMEPLKLFAKTKPVLGTCAGMVLMAGEIYQDKRGQPLLGVMDIVVERNAFGRQVNSFETGIAFSGIENGDSDPFHAVFIRAPKIVQVGGNARVLARLSDGTAVAAIQNKLMVTSFHPELTDDTRIHQYFVNLAD